MANLVLAMITPMTRPSAVWKFDLDQYKRLK
jgi:hypothetical protein